MNLTLKILLQRLFLSLVLLSLIRVGTFLPVPGVNHADIAFYIEKHSTTKNLLSTFSAGDIFIVGLFSLNLFPYINATILVQLLIGISPKLAELQKDGDFAARRSINQLTRKLALFLTLLQSAGVSFYLKQILFDWNYFLAFSVIIWMTAGAMIVLWLSEIITEQGFGNGTSILIYTNIVSNLPNLIKKTILVNNESTMLFSGVSILLLVCVSLYGIIFLQKGIRQIPLLSARQLAKSSVRKKSKDFWYLPLRFNQAGVMPIILTASLLAVPNYIISSGFVPWLSFLTSFKLFYWVSYFILVMISSSFYSAIVLKPKDLADQLQKMAVAIPGIRPGKQTIFFLKRTINRLTLIGATLLATITVIPNFIESTLNISGLNGLSTTSLLILAGVILDLIREIENIYYSNVYDEKY